MDLRITQVLRWHDERLKPGNSVENTKIIVNVDLEKYIWKPTAILSQKSGYIKEIKPIDCKIFPVNICNNGDMRFVLKLSIF